MQYTFSCLDRKLFDSKANKEHITLKEQVIGFFFSPAGTAALNAILVTYVNIYYTDVLKLKDYWGGVFLVLLPIVSKFLTVLISMIFGRMIDKTKSKRGKARPWLLISAPLVLISSILLFVNLDVSPIWNTVFIFFMYNMYFSLASSIYTMSHSLIVPLSSKVIKERNTFSIITSIGQYFGNGVFCIGVFTLLIYPFLTTHPAYWLSIISVFSVVSFICIILEYYFTIERNDEDINKEEPMSLGKQLKALFSNKYWVMIAVITLLYTFGTQIRNISVIYYCEWTLGSYEDYRKYYAWISLLGGLPLWIGAFFVKPLIERCGKKNSIIGGLVLAVIGNFMEYFMVNDFTFVVIGSFIRNIGLVPICYSLTSLLADVMDDIKNSSGQRCDGAVIGADSTIKTIFNGLAVGLFNRALVKYDYVEPDSSLTIQNPQSAEMKDAFNIMFSLIPGICALLIGVIMCFLNVEKKIGTNKENN